MAGILTFKVSEVRRLVEHSKAAAEHSASYEDLFNPAYHKGGKVKKDKSGWPDSDNLDKSKLPVALHLVGDQGCYLMSNGLPPLLVAEGNSHNVVAYARESDPTVDGDADDWYEAKRSILGGDDCVITLLAGMFESTLAMLDDDDELQLNVTTKYIQVIQPKLNKH